jgi:hypothetical protein
LLSESLQESCEHILAISAGLFSVRGMSSWLKSGSKMLHILRDAFPDAVKVAIDSLECWAFAVVAVCEPLAR